MIYLIEHSNVSSHKPNFLNNGYYFLFETKLTKKNHKYNTITYL